MLFGFSSMRPIEFDLPTPRVMQDERLPDLDSQALRLALFEKLEEERMLALRHNVQQQLKRKERFDEKIKRLDVGIGDLVLLKDSRHSKFPGKLMSRWGGPYKVTKIWRNGSLQLAFLDGVPFETRVNGSRVKRYYSNEVGWFDVRGTLTE